MRTFRMDGVPNKLFFQSNGEMDEEEIFVEAKECLSRNSSIVLLPLKKLVYIDAVDGKFGNINFSLSLDMDYGTELYCEDPDGLTKLESILNQ